MLNHNLKKIGAKLNSKGSDEAKWHERAEKIRNGATAVQRRFMEDKSKRKAARCPRRSGKSFGLTSTVLAWGEEHPGSRILIISLTIKSTKENFWEHAPGGIWEQNRMYDLKLEFNKSELTWVHENGSRGRIAGAETKADIEYFRGAAAEADLIVLDECKSFAPDLLFELIRDVIRPGLMTREGTLILAGTPGSIPQGIFYEATEPRARVKVTNEETGEPEEVPTCKLYDGTPLDDDDHRWSLHSWSIADNTAKPKQWKIALRDKKSAGWEDDNPIWRREYLGEWVTDVSDLVYTYAAMKMKGEGFWTPVEDIDNKTGLPEDEGPWHLVMGIDIGVKDASAIVVSGWSETLQQLRQIYCWSCPTFDVSTLAAEILNTIELVGKPEVMVADKGALGLMVINEINNRYPELNIIAAEKRFKYDHQVLLNDDITTGRVKLIKDSFLDHEMCGLQWKLDPMQPKKNQVIIRRGKLEEDPSCPNHLCDAFLYSWRYCYHFWAKPKTKLTEKGTSEWYKEREAKQLKEFRERMARALDEKAPDPIDNKFKRIKKNDQSRRLGRT